MEFKRFIAFFIDAFLSISLFCLITALCAIVFKLKIDDVFKPILIWGLIYSKDCIGGQSIGKRILGLQIIDEKNGEIASPFKCVLRNFFLILGVLDVIIVFFNPKKKSVGDYVARTRVIIYNKTLKNTRLTSGILTVIGVLLFFMLLEILLKEIAPMLGIVGLLYQ